LAADVAFGSKPAVRETETHFRFAPSKLPSKRALDFVGMGTRSGHMRRSRESNYSIISSAPTKMEFGIGKPSTFGFGSSGLKLFARVAVRSKMPRGHPGQGELPVIEGV